MAFIYRCQRGHSYTIKQCGFRIKLIPFCLMQIWKLIDTIDNKLSRYFQVNNIK